MVVSLALSSRRTPQDLIDSKLCAALAIAFVPGDAHRTVSLKLFAKTLGAEVAKRPAPFRIAFL